MRALKISIIIVLALIMGAMVLFLGEASVIDAVSLSFFVAIESFLGVDLRGMIKESRAKPAGDYADMHLYRYIIVMVIMAILSVLSIYVYKVYGVNMLASISLFSGGIMLTGGMVLAGLQENKIAQKTGVPK